MNVQYSVITITEKRRRDDKLFADLHSTTDCCKSTLHVYAYYGHNKFQNVSRKINGVED